MAGPYTYLGGQVLMYQGYTDDATQHVLVADPEHDGPYSMSPVDAGLPVPPSDGRWAEAAPPPAIRPAPDPIPAPVPEPDPAPAPEGGV